MHLEHHGFHLVARLHHLGGMFHAPRPGHLADVDQAFDARLQLHESPIVRDIHYVPDDARVQREALRNQFPRIGPDLLHAQGHAFLALVEFEHLDGDLVAHVQDFRRMGDPSVRHVGDVQQAVDAAQVDEGAVVGQVLDRPGDDRSFGQMLQGGALARVDLLFDGGLARHHHVAAAAIELDDFDRDVLSHQRIQVVDRTRIRLAPGHESLDPHVHRQAALDASQHAAGEDELLLVGLIQVVPHAQARGAGVR